MKEIWKDIPGKYKTCKGYIWEFAQKGGDAHVY